jgi:adenine-specific DNA methylase
MTNRGSFSKNSKRRGSEPAFPSTRYQGSKAKLAEWIWSTLSHLEFKTCLDAFGGTGAVAYRLKQAGKQVTYNDFLRFNFRIGKALIENSAVTIDSGTLDSILKRRPGISYPSFAADTFQGVYFTPEENEWIDRTITNIRALDDPYTFALAFFALCQSCLIKRPFNLFHRKNVYLRHSDVKRSFGNKTSWDRPFEEWFRFFAEEANRAVFDNGEPNRALNLDVFDIDEKAFDLVYIDTPYLSKRRVGVDYLAFYHFLEGLALYDRWPELVDYKTRHLRFKKAPSVWTDPRRIGQAFDDLFQMFRNSILVVSYRSDGIPSEAELVSLLGNYKKVVHLEHFGQYKYVLSRNSDSKEILLIGA